MRTLNGELCDPWQVRITYDVMLGWFYEPSSTCGYSIPLKHHAKALAMLERCKIGGNYIFTADMEEIMDHSGFRNRQLWHAARRKSDIRRYLKWCERAHERI